ncbi:MAG TPA: DUF2007 domain-containing protein [Chitinophagales bacterium]|nr:DUF2007 domain-containing protein [Chitinophagales bacterium]
MEKDWVKVFSVTQGYLAEILKNMLESNGIACVVINKTDSSYIVFGEAELYTHVSHAEEAKKLIEEHNA